MKKLTTTLFLAATLTLGGCQMLDPYASDFDNKITTANKRGYVIDTLGNPDDINSIELLAARLEYMSWKSRVSGKLYVIFFVQDRVVSKIIL